MLMICIILIFSCSVYSAICELCGELNFTNLNMNSKFNLFFYNKQDLTNFPS